MPARSIATATITLGMVSIPVKVYSTSESADEIHFHLLHDADGARLRQQYACTQCGEVVDREHVVRGYEHAKGQYVVFSSEEIEALDAVATGVVAVGEFVPLAAVDPLWVEKSYYLGPDSGSERGYQLLRQAMQAVYDGEPGVAIASYSARGKQYVVALRPFQSGLVMHQLRYAQEVKPWSEVPVADLPEVREAELVLARQIIGQIAHRRFDPGKYKDEVSARMRELVARKLEGQEIRATAGVSGGRRGSLLEALRATFDATPAGSGEAAASEATSRRAGVEGRGQERRSAPTRTSTRTPTKTQRRPRA